MKQRTKTLLLSSALLVGSVGSTVALAQASGGAATQAQGQQPTFTGSVPLPQENQSEDAEAAAYMSMAKVTLEQAVKAAQSSLGSTAAPSSAQLGNENGSLVWEVVISQQRVIVDAGNAKVLQTQGVNAPELADNEGDNESYDGEAQDGQMERQADDQNGAQQEQEEGGAEDGN